MAKTPRASKASDATASGKTKPVKKTAAKKAATAQDAPATKKGSKKEAAAAEAPAPKKAAKKKAAKKKAAAAEAPAPKQAAKKKAAAAEAPAPKKAAKKKAAAADAPAPKKAAKKKSASADAPAPKKAAKKKAASAAAPASEQLALSMDIGLPATDAAPVSAKPLQPGDRVPDFSLEADDGKTYSRQSLAGERFVIYFYPKDDTPGCTREACEFRDNHPRFDAASVKVLGVSGDSLKSHGRFRSKYELNFPLLADPDRTVAQAFGAVGVKKLYGKQSVGIIRSTFVVGPDGVVEKTFSPVKVDGHAEAVLQAIGSA